MDQRPLEDEVPSLLAEEFSIAATKQAMKVLHDRLVSLHLLSSLDLGTPLLCALFSRHVGGRAIVCLFLRGFSPMQIREEWVERRQDEEERV